MYAFFGIFHQIINILSNCLLEQGVRYITDIYENSNKVLSYTDLKNRVNTKINWPD